jgi:uncharacterized protein (DUF983 family)
MRFMCPACGSTIRHSEFEERPRIGVRYRCNVCRLDLQMNRAADKLVVVPIGEDEGEKRKER